MRHAFRLPLIVALLIVGACDKDPLTKPKLPPPQPTVGTGLLFASSGAFFPLREIYSMKPNGSGIARLTNDSLDDTQPRWSPDGKHVAFLRGYAASVYPTVRYNLTVMDANGANPTRLRQDLGDDSPSWSPDGSKISFVRDVDTNRELWTINADGTSPTLVSDTLGVHEVSWTRQGTFLGVDAFGIVKFNMDGSGRTRVLSLAIGTVHEVYPQMSPDGTRIVFHWYGPFDSDSQIYVVNSDGTNLQQLTNTSGLKWYPIWSPDGARIAFTRYNALVSIFTMKPDGSDVTRASPGPGDDYVGDWR